MQELEHVVRQLKAFNDYPDRDRDASRTPVLERKEPVVTLAMTKKDIPSLRAAPLAEAVEAADRDVPIAPLPPMTADHRNRPVENLSMASTRPTPPGRKLFAEGPEGPGGSGAVPPGGGSDGSGTDDRDRRKAGGWFNWLGAAAAILLVGIVGLWTYKLGQREAMEVPIVRALEGPNRVQPSDPGGTTIAHQGHSVNGVLEGGGVAGVAEVIRTAPGDERAQPEDRPGGELIGLAEAQKPNSRPIRVDAGSAASMEERAALVIDDVLAMAHSGLPQAETVDLRTSGAFAPVSAEETAAAERDAIDAIVSAIALNDEASEAEALLSAMEVVDGVAPDPVRLESDALLAAEAEALTGQDGVRFEENQVIALEAGEAEADLLGAVEVALAPVQVSAEASVASSIAPEAETQVAFESLPELTISTSVEAPVRDVVAGARVAISEPVTLAPKMDVSDPPRVDLTEPLVVASAGPVPPQGEGSNFAPVRQAQPRARPRDLATQMRRAVDGAVAAIGGNAPRSEPAGRPIPVLETAEAGALDVIPLPVGTRMIQIGAFDSEAIARQQWDRFSSLHADMLWDKEPFVQRTNNSGRVFYRLRVAGYVNKEDTRAACAELGARGLPCMSVTLR